MCVRKVPCMEFNHKLGYLRRFILYILQIVLCMLQSFTEINFSQTVDDTNTENKPDHGILFS